MTIKMMIFGRRRPGLTLQESRKHLKDVHGKLVLDYIALDPENAPRRYVQNHAFDGIYPGSEGQPKAFVTGLDFVTEVSFPDLATLKVSRETPYYIEKLLPDEPLMVDAANVVGVPTTEEVVKPFPADQSASIKVFLVWHGAAPGVSAISETIANIQSAPVGYTRNTPAVPSAMPGIDEFWFSSEVDAQAFASACRDALLRSAETGSGSFTLTIAREHVLNAG